MEAQITFQSRGIGGGLLQDVSRHVDEGRAAFRDESRREFSPRAFHHVKRAALRIEHPRRAFHDQAVQIRGANRFREGFTEPVEKIEDERFFDLDFFLRAFELADADPLLPPSEGPTRERCDQQAE